MINISSYFHCINESNQLVFDILRTYVTTHGVFGWGRRFEGGNLVIGK